MSDKNPKTADEQGRTGNEMNQVRVLDLPQPSWCNQNDDDLFDLVQYSQSIHQVQNSFIHGECHFGGSNQQENVQELCV